MRYLKNKIINFFNLHWKETIFFLITTILWLDFYGWFQIRVIGHDYRHVANWFFILSDSLRNYEIPFYSGLSNPWNSEYFLGIIDVIYSPLILFNLSLTVKIILHFIFFLFISFYSVIRFKKYFNLSFDVFIVFSILFYFNGMIVSRLSVGHITFLPYFLLPIYFIFIHEFLEHKNNHIKFSLLFAFIISQGGFQIFYMLFIYLGLIVLFNLHLFFKFLKIVILTFLLSAFKILPTFYSMKTYTTREFAGGIDSFSSLIDSLITSVIPMSGYEIEMIGYQISSNISWHEINFFIGLIGFLILFGFIIYAFINKKMKKIIETHLKPLLVILFLSYSANYLIFYQLEIPLTNSIRLSSRFFLVFIIMCIFIASISLNHYLKNKSFKIIEKLIFLFLLVSPLFSNLIMNKVERRSLQAISERSNFNYEWRISYLNDHIYEAIVINAHIISLFTLIVLIAYQFLKKKNLI